MEREEFKGDLQRLASGVPVPPHSIRMRHTSTWLVKKGKVMKTKTKTKK
jgi:hypothetical protein